MKRLILTFLTLPLVFSAFSQPWYSLDTDSAKRASWGPDKRAEAKAKLEYLDYTRATATSVKLWQVKGDQIYSPTLRENLVYSMKSRGIDPTNQYNFDENVRYLDQPSCGSCTGFLIAPDILVTAGHCFHSPGDLDSTVWLFDYTSDIAFNASSHKITVPQSKQYRCVEMLDHALIGSQGWDYSIIRLDRKVEGRKPYKFRTGGKNELNQFIAMIGSPRGLPLKLVDSARITNPNEGKTFFLTNLTAFHGNSGGPVFNSNGWIEGILVRAPTGLAALGGDEGDYDYHYDEACQCIKQDVYYDLYSIFGLNAQNGTEVQRLTKTNYDLLLYAVYRNLEYAIKDNDVAAFEDWGLYSWIWTLDLGARDEKYKTLDPLLAMAIKNYRAEFVSTILDAENLDFNMKDNNGVPILSLMVQNGMADAITKANSKSNGALDFNKVDGHNETPLMFAARTGNMQIIELLLSNGANAKMKNADGKTARSIAKDYKMKDAVKRLKKAEKAK